MDTLKNKLSDSSTFPIGVFDSGVGGLSVLQHIHEALPAEDLLYFADSRFAPYGSKSPEAIRERAIFLSDFLISRGAKALVVACNTATAAAISVLRERYTLPIIGMEPAVKPAAAATKSGVIGVLATSGTLKSAQFAALLESYGQNVSVVTQACHGLVECVERGELKLQSTKDLISNYVSPLLIAGADTIVLGCTHYPFVRPLIEDVIREQSQGAEVTLIDTGAAVARQLQKCLNAAGLLRESTKPVANGEGVSSGGKVQFWSNSDADDAAKVISKLWGKDVALTPFPQ